MSMPADARDVRSLQLRLSFASDPRTGAYEVTIEFGEIDVIVEARDMDLRRAIRRVTDLCAERLCDEGYAVTPADVFVALEEALRRSGFVRSSPQDWN